MSKLVLNVKKQFCNVKVCNSQGEILDWLNDLDKEINKDKKV